MTGKELRFTQDFQSLLDHYQVQLEVYINDHQPESGFITNFQSLRVVGLDVDLDLYELIGNASH